MDLHLQRWVVQNKGDTAGTSTRASEGDKGMKFKNKEVMQDREDEGDKLEISWNTSDDELLYEKFQVGQEAQSKQGLNLWLSKCSNTAPMKTLNQDMGKQMSVDMLNGNNEESSDKWDKQTTSKDNNEILRMKSSIEKEKNIDEVIPKNISEAQILPVIR